MADVLERRLDEKKQLKNRELELKEEELRIRKMEAETERLRVDTLNRQLANQHELILKLIDSNSSSNASHILNEL